MLPLFLSAQQLELWKNHSNTNDIRKISIKGDNLWGVTGGGLFSYNSADRSITQYTKSENLSSQDLSAIAVDANGLVWIGSREGFINVLNPADGSVRKIYDIYNSSRAQKGINSFLISGDTLYVSHDFGLSLINTRTFNFMDNVVKFGTLQTESKVVSVSKFSRIYACLSEGLAVLKAGAQNLFAPDSWDSYPSEGILLYKAVFFNGEIYAATNNGLYKFNGTALTPFYFTGERVLDLLVSGNLMYLVTPTSVYSYSGNFTTVYSTSESGHILSSLAVSSGTVYVSSNKGITRIPPESSASTLIERIYTNSPITNAFMNMDVDSDGNLWAATGKDGYGRSVMRFDGTTWSGFYSLTAPPYLNDMHNVYAGTDGKIYWLNWGRGFSTYVNNIQTNYNASNSIMVGIKNDPGFVVISDIKNDSHGNAWVLNYWPVDKNILYSISSGGTWTPYNFPSITGGQTFNRLVIDKYNTKWIAVSANVIEGGNRGLMAFNESTQTPRNQFYSFADGLNSDLVNTIAIDLRGYLWIGTSSGLNYIPDTSNPRINAPFNPGIKYQNITSIKVDALDQKWVGTKAGLFVLSPDGVSQIKHYDIGNSPLPSNEIVSLAIDRKNGIIYIGTDYGLTVLKTDFVEPKQSFEEITTYPSPFIVGDGKNTLMKIEGLIKESSIKVLSVTGELVNEFRTSGGRIGFWNGKDKEGNFVSTGVYYLIAYDQEGNNIAKARIAVIKK